MGGTNPSKGQERQVKTSACLQSGITLMGGSCYHQSPPQLSSDKALAMNKKVQKQLDVARKKLANLQQQLAGAKKQPDDPADVPRLEKEIAAVHAEITKLKSAE